MISGRFAAFSIALTFVSACTPEAQNGAVNEEAALQAIDESRSRFENAVAEYDLEAMGGMVAEGAIMVQPGSSDWIRMQELAAGAPFPAGATIRITPFETKIITPEWAYEFGSSLITYPDPDTGEVIELRDTYLLLLKNTDNGWLPFREVASASAPPTTGADPR